MGKKKDDWKRKDGREKAPIEEVIAELPQAVTQAARSLRTILSRNLTDAGLYAGQDGVMQALGAEDGMTAGSLAVRLGVKAPTMTRTIGRMEAQGFVMRRPDETDQRLTKVFLTEAGRKSLDDIEAALSRSREQAFAGFSNKQMRQLLKLLKALDQNLKGTAETDYLDGTDDEE